MLEIEPAWAPVIADWIDIDSDPGFPDGAEDAVYTSLTPPHRAANMPITRASEIMVMNGFGAERYAKLAPYITALPAGTGLNVCTASGIVLDSLVDGVREFSLNPEDLAKRRTEVCFPTKSELQGALGNQEFDKVKNSLTESSTLLPRNGMGHYWHYPAHAVQSPRPRKAGSGEDHPAQFGQRVAPEVRWQRHW